MQAKREIKIDSKCHRKYGKRILFRLLKQTLGVSELTGLHYQTLRARHRCSLININMTAINCLYLLQALIKAKSWVCTLYTPHRPRWHAARPSQMFSAAFPCWRPSLLRAKAFPLLPPPCSALQTAALNTQCHLWSWPQIIDSRRKTQVARRKGLCRTKGCPLPERWDLKGTTNTSSPPFPQRSADRPRWRLQSQSRPEGRILSTV